MKRLLFLLAGALTTAGIASAQSPFPGGQAFPPSYYFAPGDTNVFKGVRKGLLLLAENLKALRENGPAPLGPVKTFVSPGAK